MQISLLDVPKIEIGLFQYIVWKRLFSLQWVNLYIHIPTAFAYQCTNFSLSQSNWDLTIKVSFKPVADIIIYIL